MSVTTQAPGSGASDVDLPPPSDGGLVTPRGETTIAPGVAAKIAARAAAEVEGVGGVVDTGLGRLLPWTTSTTPARADAEIDHGAVQVDLTVNVVYPQPVGQVTSRVRERVTRRLAELCGLRATHVNITVPELVPPDRPARRRVV
jgi:uncharacterized alkaline shock family protein YloU